MPANLPVRAAGRTLTIGELREALDRFRDDDQILVDGDPVFYAESHGGLLRLSTDDVGTGGATSPGSHCRAEDLDGHSVSAAPELPPRWVIDQPGIYPGMPAAVWS